MTLFTVAGGERSVTVRYVPLMAWAFVALAAYGAVQIVRGMATGLAPASPGALLALAVLVGFTLFIVHTAGQLVVASFDRAADLVRVRRYGLTGRQLEERRLSEVVGLDVRMLRRAQHRVELRLSSGERLPLTSYYVVTFNSSGLSRLAGALGLQPTMIEPPRR